MKFLLIRGRRCKEATAKYLIKEAKKYFDTVLSVPLSGIRVACENGKTSVYYKDTNLATFDACLPRLFGDEFVFAQVVLEVLGSNEVYMPVSVEAFEISNHKYYTVKRLASVGVPVPATSLCVGQEPAIKLMKKIGFPAVVKLISGFGGRGVMLVQNESEFKPLLDTLRVFKEFLSSQEFIDARDRSDLRCFVIGNKVFGIKRTPPRGEWRTNVTRGASAREVRVPKTYRDMVLKSTALLDMEIGAIDFLESREGPVTLEVNFCPGLMVDIFGRKFAERIMPFIHKRAKEFNYGE